MAESGTYVPQSSFLVSNSVNPACSFGSGQAHIWDESVLPTRRMFHSMSGPVRLHPHIDVEPASFLRQWPEGQSNDE